MKYFPNINFADPLQIRRAHEAVMHEVNREAICIGTKYSVKMEPMYFQWDKLILKLEKHFTDILEEILNHDHQRCGLK